MESNKSSSHGDVSTSPSFLNNHHQFNNGGDIIPKKKKNRIMHVGSYEVGKTLGNGTFGKVKLGTNICTKENVAIKFIKNNKLSGKQKETCFREIDIMKLLDHPNIVKLLDVVDKREEEGTTYLIVEYVSGGELFDYIVAREYIKEKEARKFFRQMISAIEYCHANLIVHRDLKPENLLLDSNGDIKISDFGLSNNIQPGKLLESFCGSPLYAAPEILKAEKYLGPPVDIWSLGVIMYAVLCGNLPWEGDSQAEISFNSVHGNYEDPTHLSAEAVHILRRMIVPNPKDRATIQELKNHPWTNIDYQEIPKSHLPPRDAVHEIKEDIFAHLISLGFPNTKETRDIILKNENCGIVNVYHLLLDRYASKEVENLKSKLELLSKRKKSFSDKRNPSTNSLASIPEDSNDLSSNNNNNQQQQNSPPSKTNSSSTSSSNRESNNNSPSQGSIKEISLDELDNHIEQLDNDIENSDNNKSSSLTRRSSDPNKDIENSLKAQGLFSSYSAPGVPNSDHNYDFETYQQQQQYQQQLHQQQLQLQQQYQSQIQSDISFPHDDVEIESYSIQQQQLQQQQQQQQQISDVNSTATSNNNNSILDGANSDIINNTNSNNDVNNEKLKKQKSDEENFYYHTIKLTLDYDFEKSQSFELVDFVKHNPIKIRKLSTLLELKLQIQMIYGVSFERQRIWFWDPTPTKASRVTRCPLLLDDEDIFSQYLNMHGQATEMRFHLEVSNLPNPNEKNLFFDPINNDLILIFFKYYDPYKKQLEFISTKVCQSNSPISCLIPFLNQKLCHKSDDPNSPLLLFGEDSNGVSALDPHKTLKSYEIANGSMIICQRSLSLRENVQFPYLSDYYNFTFHKVVIAFQIMNYKNTNSQTDLSFKMEVLKGMKYKEIIKRISEIIQTFPQNINLYSLPNGDTSGAFKIINPTILGEKAVYDTLLSTQRNVSLIMVEVKETILPVHFLSSLDKTKVFNL